MGLDVWAGRLPEQVTADLGGALVSPMLWHFLLMTALVVEIDGLGGALVPGPRRGALLAEVADLGDQERSAHARGDGDGLQIGTASAVVVPIAEARRVQSGQSAANQYLSVMMGDAPFCDQCGSITVRNGACYKCLNCGNSMGCS